jgi:hypothetical protein
MSAARKPQASQRSANVHGFDVRMRLEAIEDADCGVVLPAAAEKGGVDGVIGGEAGRAMTSEESVCSTLSRPSKMGVCALLEDISDLTHTIQHWVLTGR